ncbi:MAG: winged helix-turn-helix transcriptional regulator [Tissierellia bacterium]|nr:winged helix-turn-helix transcriptional regulator [Tissierellia bacterium]
MTNREKQILRLIKSNPSISQKEIAEILQISRSSVAVHITRLMEKGYILGRCYLIAKDQYATVIGGTTLDIVGRSTESLRDHDSNIGSINVSSGGVARNIAENMGRLNMTVRFISAFGNDIAGDTIKKSLSDFDIDYSYSYNSPDLPSAKYMAILDDDGDMLMAVSDLSIIENITPEFIESNLEIIRSSEITVLDTNLRLDTLEYILKSIPGKYFIDTVSLKKSEKLKNLLSYIHTLKPNRYEAEILSGIKVYDFDSAIKAGKRLNELGVKRAIITLGEKGAVLTEGDEILKATAKPIEAVNATGAGDALMGALAYSYMEGYCNSEALKIALAAARITIEDRNTISNKINEENLSIRKGEIKICKN